MPECVAGELSLHVSYRCPHCGEDTTEDVGLDHLDKIGVLDFYHFKLTCRCGATVRVEC